MPDITKATFTSNDVDSSDIAGPHHRCPEKGTDESDTNARDKTVLEQRLLLARASVWWLDQLRTGQADLGQ